MPRTRGLAHVNLHVSDIDRSVRFYTKVFDLELVGEGTGTVQSKGQPVEVRQALLSTPGRQDLLALTHAASIPIGSAGLNHIGFFFESDEDVRIAIEVVPRHGGKIIQEGEREGEVFAYAEDPDGYRIEMSTPPIVLSAGRDKVPG
jgi:lactoylglutathione lyase